MRTRHDIWNGRPTISVRVSNEDGIYASEAVLREPLYGGVQKTLPDVYYDRSGDNKSN